MPLSYLTLTLAGTGAVSAWSFYIQYRQYRKTLTAPPPASVERIRTVLGMDEAAIAKSQVYRRDKLTFSMVSEVLDKGTTMLFLAAKLLPVIWDGTERLFGVTPSGYLHGVLYSITTELLSSLISVPLDYYDTFIIEAKHGFNKQTLSVWMKDQVINLLLKLCVLHPAVNALFHYVVTYFGPAFPNYLFAGGLVGVAAFLYIYPNFYQPLFNKFTPLPDGSLKDEIVKLAAKLKFPLTRLYEVDESSRSAHSNAYFYGFGNNKRIVLYDTLRQQLSDDEILAVLSHEFGHWHNNHTSQLLGTATVQLYAISQALKLSLYDTNIVTDFGFSLANATIPIGGSSSSNQRQVNPVLGFELLGMALLEPAMNIISIAVNSLIRHNEFVADSFATELGYGLHLRNALQKINKENKSNVNPDWLYAACEYTHPPTIERLAAIDEMLKKSS